MDLQELAEIVNRHSGPGDNGCVVWTGNTDREGYGRIRYEGRFLPASRVALAVSIGRWLERGEQALHSCDNPPCVNVGHLRVGTNLDNVRDRDRRGRQARGERSPRSRLKDAQVIEIRRLVPTHTYAALAAQFGVAAPTIRNIALGATWKHI